MSLSFTSTRLLVLPGLACCALLAGCVSSNPCGGNSDYLTAIDRGRLQLPEGVSGSERLGGGTAMTIPPAAANPDTLDPQPACLDQPPPYAALKKTAKPAPTTAAPPPAPPSPSE